MGSRGVFREAAGRGRREVLHDARVCNWRDAHIQLHSLDTDLSVVQTYIGAPRECLEALTGYPVNLSKTGEVCIRGGGGEKREKRKGKEREEQRKIREKIRKIEKRNASEWCICSPEIEPFPSLSLGLSQPVHEEVNKIGILKSTPQKFPSLPCIYKESEPILKGLKDPHKSRYKKPWVWNFWIWRCFQGKLAGNSNSNKTRPTPNRTRRDETGQNSHPWER